MSKETDFEAQNALLRREWFLDRCVANQHHTYGDDGELCCHTCGVDFQREHPAMIIRQLHLNGMRRLEEDPALAASVRKTIEEEMGAPRISLPEGGR